ncbi:PREDICTED: vegetative cell wall protein gp1-like [Chrysochloris asiatica]|uniref:Vegetative cell wall protein gp1-like n=1 Tax=Chrysochloris asiatica TaxID=185453 RepID=A0A9B0TEM7_CHRAS|nr:PREDICTED: vegetative cell wall protein gp1-like [Chrysochloris asiatica]
MALTTNNGAYIRAIDYSPFAELLHGGTVRSRQTREPEVSTQCRRPSAGRPLRMHGCNTPNVHKRQHGAHPHPPTLIRATPALPLQIKTRTTPNPAPSNPVLCNSGHAPSKPRLVRPQPYTLGLCTPISHPPILTHATPALPAPTPPHKTPALIQSHNPDPAPFTPGLCPTNPTLQPRPPPPRPPPAPPLFPSPTGEPPANPLKSREAPLLHPSPGTHARAGASRPAHLPPTPAPETASGSDQSSAVATSFPFRDCGHLGRKRRSRPPLPLRAGGRAHPKIGRLWPSSARLLSPRRSQPPFHFRFRGGGRGHIRLRAARPAPNPRPRPRSSLAPRCLSCGAGPPRMDVLSSVRVQA